MSTSGQARSALKALGQTTFGDGTPGTILRTTFGSRVTVQSSLGGWLVIGGVRGNSTPEGLGPHRPMVEEYDIECSFSYTVNGKTGDQERVSNQVTTWFTTYEEAIRAFPGQGLGIPGVLWAGVMGDFEHQDSPASETAGPINSWYTFNVHVRANYRLS